MRYFITGASGWIGSAVTRELVAAGHQVVGLARSDASAARVAELGATPVRGALADLEVLRDAAAAADGVVHLGFIHNFDDFATSVAVDRAAIEVLGTAMADSGRPFVVASGFAGLAPGSIATEETPVNRDLGPRIENAILAESFADRGVRVIFARFAPTVHGMGDHGFISRIAGIARDTGVSAYIGDGTNRWGAVHRLDAAHLVRLVLDRPEAATVVHASGEVGIPARDIAQALGDRFGLPVTSIASEAADEHFGWIGPFFAGDLAGSSVLTRERFDWHPTHPTLLEDIAAGAYDAGAMESAA
jgi:nucleoside-diphosphate-sugar epimerase